MKKICALLLALCLPVTALAEEATANGVVESRSIQSVVAPFSGVLKPFDWESGDRVESGETLFEMQTTKVCAPEDGIIRGVFAVSGDQAESVLAQYGMLAGIEKAHPLLIQATTNGAYKEAENRWIHAGEIVYFEQSNDRDNEGEGRVIAVSGNHYTVEISKGDFEDGDSVKLYRDEKMGTKSCIGSGSVEYAADLAVTGSGYVVSCFAHEGDTVHKGDVLFELVSQDADYGVSTPSILSASEGALEICTQSGAQVYKGQLLARVHSLNELSVVASVDEVDLNGLSLGDPLTIVFDRYPQEIVTGIVSEISALGTARQNASYYNVTINFHATLDILPGMNATVHLKEQ